MVIVIPKTNTLQIYILKVGQEGSTLNAGISYIPPVVLFSQTALLPSYLSKVNKVSSESFDNFSIESDTARCFFNSSINLFTKELL